MSINQAINQLTKPSPRQQMQQDQHSQKLAKNKAVSSLKSLGEKETLKNDVGAYMARAGEHHQRSLRNQAKVETLRKINELGKYNSLSSEAEYKKIYKALEENNPGPGPKPAALNFLGGGDGGR